MSDTLSTDVTSTYLSTAGESRKEFIARCWASQGVGCYQVLWHVFEKGLFSVEKCLLDANLAR
eukprot:13790035-Alexandrium_andersonii.AAC.1